MNKIFRAVWLWAIVALCLIAAVISIPGIRNNAENTGREALATQELAPTPQDSLQPALAISTPQATPTASAVPTPSPTPAPTPFSFVWVSDTQVYGYRYPDVYANMAQWIVDEQEAQNFLGVLHVGDVIDNRKEPGHWKKISKGMDILKDQIPRYIAAGNHDVGWPEPDYSIYLSYDFCDVREPSQLFNDGQCWIQPMTVGGRDLLLLGIGWPGSDDAYLQWAGEQMDAHPNHTVIIITHGFMLPSGKLVGAGERLEAIFADHPNIRLLICGHALGEHKWEKSYEAGHTVTALLYNLQEEHMSKKGLGYLRILTFDPIENTMQCITYSPYLDDYNYYSEERESFTLENFFIA